jgi:hypothetical protein
MLESIKNFINRLRIYAGMPHPMQAVDEIAVKSMVELISTLVLVTQKLKKRRSRESFLANSLLCSTPHSQMGEELFRGYGDQQSSPEA